MTKLPSAFVNFTSTSCSGLTSSASPRDGSSRRGHVGAYDAQGLGANQRADELLDGQIDEILAAKQCRQRGRNLRLNLAFRIHQKESDGTGLQNGVRKPIAGVDEFLFFALMAFNGDEHGPHRVPKRSSAGHDGFHSLKAAIYLIFAAATACDGRHSFRSDYATAAIGPKSASNSSAEA